MGLGATQEERRTSMAEEPSGALTRRLVPGADLSVVMTTKGSDREDEPEPESVPLDVVPASAA